MNRFRFLFALTLCGACQSNQKLPEQPMSRKDIHSYTGDAVITHLVLDLEVNFENRVLKGSAIYKIDPKNSDHIILDVNGPEILSVEVDNQPATYKLSEQDPILGMALTIPIHADSKSIKINYQTKPDASALQWLNPQQTAGNKHPFLFSQGQAILTRTWIPIQDSPGIRITYEATLRVPKDLMAVMSARNAQQKNPDGIYHFTMPQAVPAYLIALAVGDLNFKSTGPRSGVYAEPNMLEKAAWEFADTENMIAAAEKLYGPYAWDRYDLLVLPPSFPFGGMENPRLTFATPTVIAGDRSLVSLVAHELAHSWSGNLVTNANWNDFWINEGFTTYFERRIMENLYGREYTEMLASLAKEELKQNVLEIGPDHKDTRLHLDLLGRNPDDGMTSIAYEKGAFFLRMLEEKIGRPRFDIFLKTYFDQHAFQSMDVDKLVRYLKANLPIDSLKIDLDAWIYRPGIPEEIAEVNSDRFDNVVKAYNLMEAEQHWDTLMMADWSSHEWVHFIAQIPDSVQPAQLVKMDEAFHFSTSGNSEILDTWFEKAILGGYSPTILSRIESFLIQVGRRKYLVPLYKAFKITGQIETARKIYAQARPNYHFVATSTIDQLLKE